MSEKEVNYFDNWLEMQKNMMEFWKEAGSKNNPMAFMNPKASEQAQEMMNNWQDMQKKMLEFWKEAGSDFNPADPASFMNVNREQFQGMISNWQDMQKKMAELWGIQGSPFSFENIFDPQGTMNNFFTADNLNKFYRDWLKNSSQSMGELMQWFPSGVGKETFSKIKQAGDVYINLLVFWMENMINVPDKDDMQNWEEFYRSWINNYNTVLDSFFMMNLPEPVKNIAAGQAKTAELFQQLLSTFLYPCFEAAPELKDSLIKSLQGDREAYKDFIKNIHSMYQESYGRLFRVPAFGLSKDNLENLTAGIDAYVQFSAAMNEFMALLYKNGYDVMEDVLNKTNVMIEDGVAPSSFKEFYELWWKTNEEAFFEVFSTESFGKIIGQVVNSGAKFKKAYDKLMTVVITENLPLPTQQDMDSVYKAIYVLKKKVNELEKKISAADITETDELSKAVSALNTNMEKLEKRLEKSESLNEKGGNKS